METMMEEDLRLETDEKNLINNAYVCDNCGEYFSPPLDRAIDETKHLKDCPYCNPEKFESEGEDENG